MKIHLQDIPTEKGHNKTVYKRPLINVSDKNGYIATYNYAWLEKGMELEPHVHPDGEEYYLFIEGDGEMLVGEEWFPVGKGDYVKVPQNTIHSLKNNKEQNLVFVTLRSMVK